jgi:FkbM family methyltransferase
MPTAREVLKSVLLALPDMRRVFDQRDAALRDLAAIKGGGATTLDDGEAIRAFLLTFAFVKRGLPPVDGLSPRECAGFLQEMGWRAFAKGVVDAIAASSKDSWVRVNFNGVPLELPRYTLMTMRHCISPQPDGRINMLVETAHWERMRAELSEGSLFLDIGAATGAMSIPFALTVKTDARLVAFEPSRRARDYLAATAARNKAHDPAMKDLRIMACALSDAPGSLSFMELPEDETGDTPFLPEGSRLRVDEADTYENAANYQVDVSTLDALAGELDFASAKKIVMKIDVEGFEAMVLKGGIKTLAAHKPFMAIDIHGTPGGDGTQTTEAAVMAVITPFGYKVERLGHVLVCRA